MTRSSHAVRSVTRQMVSQGSRAMAGRKAEAALDDVSLENPIPREPLISSFIETLGKPRVATRAAEKVRAVQPEPLEPKRAGERWLTVVEAAVILDVGPHAVRKAAVRLGLVTKPLNSSIGSGGRKKVLYLESDIEKYLYARNPKGHISGKLSAAKRAVNQVNASRATQAAEKLEQYQFPGAKMQEPKSGLQKILEGADFLAKMEEPKMGKWSEIAKTLETPQHPDRLEAVLARLEGMVKNADMEAMRVDFRRVHEAAGMLLISAGYTAGVFVAPENEMRDFFTALQIMSENWLLEEKS